MSSKNPFRHPTPEVTVAPPSPPLPPLPHASELPPLPPTSDSAIPPPTSAPPTFEEEFGDDLPPPYTPAANPSIGEETISLGPRRPFQQPPPPPPSSLHPSPGSRPHSNRPPPSAQPFQPFSTSPGSSSGFRIQADSRPGQAPWQTQQQYRQRQHGGGGLLGALFDTVRDIADVVSGAHDERVMATRTANAGAYATPYSSAGTVYAPPPGPPRQTYQPSPPRRPASTPPSSSPPTVPDDGSPTRTPVPGHPLLRDGQLLVYPRDYLCVKCAFFHSLAMMHVFTHTRTGKNTGYKNYDPSNPCRKCWEKYAKPYTGALAYTPWSPSGNDPRMQRPLAKFVPPHLAGRGPGSSSCSSYASQSYSSRHLPPPQHPHHSRSISQPPHMDSPGSGPSYYVLNPLGPYDATPPVPHAIPISPGDPRLGGRLCMRCGGEGVRTVMLIDVMTCDSCGGTGRVWV